MYQYKTTSGFSSDDPKHPNDGFNNWELVCMAIWENKLYWSWRRKLSEEKNAFYNP